MHNKSNQNNHRDFIDFLLLLYSHSKLFILILIVFSSIAVFVNQTQGQFYNFNVRIKVTASNDVFSPVIMYRDNLRRSSDEAITDKGKEFSSLGVDQLVNDLLLGGRIYPLLDSKISEATSIDFDSRSFIDSKRDGQYFNIVVRSKDKVIVSSFHENLLPIMKNEMTRIYTSILNTHKANTISKIEALIKYDTANRLRDVSTELLKSQFQENQTSNISDELISRAVYSSYNEKLEYIKDLEIPSLDSPYIYFVQSPISESKGISPIFVYLFSTFLSIFLFVFVVIIIDLKNQVFLRKEFQTKTR
jgi:hypothetical protein